MAKRSRINSARTSHPAKKSGALATILLAFFSGYIIANIFNINDLSRYSAQAWNAIKPDSKESPKNTTAQQAQLPKPKFEFYTLLSNDKPGRGASHQINTHALPSSEVREISKAIQTQVHQATALAPITETHPRHYDIQLASYNKKSDAERLKASLLLRDFNAKIEAVAQKNGHWFRVIIGPYSSKQAAEKAQLSIARSDKVMGIIRRLDA